MKRAVIYIRVISTILTIALLFSACAAQETGKQSLSATGAAVLSPSGVETETPLGASARSGRHAS